MAGHSPSKTGVNALMSRPSRFGGHSVVRRQAFLALTLTFLATPALAQQTCAPPLKPMLRAELYFGLAVAGRAAVTRREWDGFVGRELTPRFPGLTVLDGRGAWRNGGRDVRERTKVV